MSSLSKRGEASVVGRTSVEAREMNLRETFQKVIFHSVPFWFKILPELPGCTGCFEVRNKTGFHPEMLKTRRQCLELKGTTHSALAMASCEGLLCTRLLVKALC